MAIQLNYDIQNKYGTTRKITGKTNYYVGIAKICPRCEQPITGYPALSRKDNKTEICSNCGNLEAVEDFINRKETKKWVNMKV